MSDPRFEPTWESVRTHEVPAWFDDAKFGVFLHWGLYSVPGWAPQVPDIQQQLIHGGPRQMLRDNPYAEWYLNSMHVEGSATQRHHRQTYGAGATYDDFVDAFDTASSGADLDQLADLCRASGAQYVVLTTKHHDGFALWPSSIDHPTKGTYHARRDLVGDLTRAARGAGMRMGLYYSGGYDWPYNDVTMSSLSDVILAGPADDAYRAYVTAHVRELIDRYEPSVLWNDIAWPPGDGLAGLFAHFYNVVDDGVINDRWVQPAGARNAAVESAVRLVCAGVERAWRVIPESKKSLTFPGAKHYDFTTPEYTHFDEISERKWEMTRGVGHSFGANRNEDPDDIITGTELVRLFCEVISCNGNLLLGVGPDPSGEIPPEQAAPLQAMGEWLGTNGAAVHGSRPWLVPSADTSEGTRVRFTRDDDRVFAFLVDAPGRATLSLRDVVAGHVDSVRLLGDEAALEHRVDHGVLSITLPQRLPVSPAHTLAIEGDLHPS